VADKDDGLLVVLVAAAALMAAAYLLDVIGLAIHMWLLAAVAVAVPAVLVLSSPGRRAPRLTTVPQYAVALAVLTFALWIAWPGLLPVTIGPDVVHHLQLIHVIAATGRLPHDAALQPYLAEMMNYTPGSHVLAAAIGAWVRVDPLFVVYPLAAAAVALKAALLYALARRLLGSTPRAAVQALAAPILVFAPVYFLGSFVHFFFLGQVVSETFAIGMLSALTAWLSSSSRRDLWFAGACGAGIVLSWPIWIVPAAAAAIVVAVQGSPRWRERIAVLGVVLGPAIVLGVLHQALHRDAASIVTSAGAVTAPSIDVFGAGFLIAAAAGALLGLRDRGARAVVAFLAATLLLSGLLAVLAIRAGSNSFYMAFKMMYLAILPAAVLGGVALARVADLAVSRLRNVRIRSTAIGGVVAALLPVLVAASLVRGRVPVRPVRGSLSAPARDVGLWARGHVPGECIDYFSRYWLTGYWLHLDVLGNPRESDRMRQETFDFPDVAAKWIEGRGLPYAIVENLSAIPREARVDMEPLHQSGSFVLVRNARPAACPTR
jgi:hypothetical protein